jgi:hypothetical protein
MTTSLLVRSGGDQTLTSQLSAATSWQPTRRLRIGRSLRPLLLGAAHAPSRRTSRERPTSIAAADIGFEQAAGWNRPTRVAISPLCGQTTDHLHPVDFINCTGSSFIPGSRISHPQPSSPASIVGSGRTGASASARTTSGSPWSKPTRCSARPAGLSIRAKAIVNRICVIIDPSAAGASPKSETGVVAGMSSSRRRFQT